MLGRASNLAVGSNILPAVLRVLLTNDDGIDAEGLQALRRALVALDDITVAVVAPDDNRTATGREVRRGKMGSIVPPHR